MDIYLTETHPKVTLNINILILSNGKPGVYQVK